MGSAAAVVGLVLEKLSALLMEEVALLSNLGEEIDRLRSSFSLIMAVLDDAEERMWTEHSVKAWLGKVKDVVYDVEDVLDEFESEFASRRPDAKARIGDKVRALFPSQCVASIRFRYKMGRKVKLVADRLDTIAEEMSKFNLVQTLVDPDRLGTKDETYSFILESEVVGRDRDRTSLIQRLVDAGREEEVVSVVPIVGMGGIGKTTLAKLVYNDESVKACFDVRIWVCVAEGFDVAAVARVIVESAGEYGRGAEDAPDSRLRGALKGKRFLLVLDDVWNEDREKWAKLRALLECGGRGSRVIVTTRSMRVASIMSSSSANYYLLKPLSNDECWSLFIRYAFSLEEEEKYPNLVKIGREIVKRCGGLPLAVKALGGLLRRHRSEKEWFRIRDNPTWMTDEESSLILPTLRLSYNHLPSVLKSCFAYCCLFPSGFEFEKDKMIQLWIAEGFITMRQHIPMEDVGEDYINELCQRSLFQLDSQHNMVGGRIATFRMHDLIHDLARVVAGSESSLVEVGETHNIAKRMRRLSFSSNRRTSIDPACFQHTKLQTFILLNDGLSKKIEVPNEVFRLAFLRVLDLSNSNLKTVPRSIGKHKHLRFLDLSNTDIAMLPESITSLRHLQTLRLLNCMRLHELPNDLSKMVNLRHLEMNHHWKISVMPPNIGQLTCLQTLTFFIVGKKSGCGIEELHGLNLRGALTIRNLENVLKSIETEKVGLKQKYKLHSLHLSWGEANDSNANYEDVVEALQPHQNTQGLSFKNYMGRKFPSWLTDLTLNNLVEVALINCKRCENLPPLCQLNFLESLCVEGMPELKKWSSDETRPVLPHLTRLEIIRCPELMQLPQLPSLKILFLSGCNELILRSAIESTLLCRLRICGFSEMISFPKSFFGNKTHLKYLEISDCPKLISLSEDLFNFTTISHLVIRNCDGIESLMEGWHELTSLKLLTIVECRYLKSLPSEVLCGLTSLQSLNILSCQSLTNLEGLHHLSSLKDLHISDCPNLVALPNCMENLNGLKVLTLKGLPKLRSFSELGTLTSLEELNIESCYRIEALPSSLPNMTAIQELSICDCPRLQSRYSSKMGDDWFKISHLPSIKIKQQQ